VEEVLSPEEFLSGLNQSEKYEVTVTLDDVKKYCEAAKDDNPLHFGEEGNVVPGGLITSLFLSNPQPGFFVRSYKVDFHKVSHFPTTITITRTMTKTRVRKFGYHGVCVGEARNNGVLVATAEMETFKPNERVKEKYERG